MGEIQTLVVKRWTGKRKEMDTYRFVNQVPLRDGEDALLINWCELVTTLEDGKIIYKNAFATNHDITPENVKEVVEAGQARWKIENENNNTLKTKGYHLEHNFGHGKKHLSSLLLRAHSKITSHFYILALGRLRLLLNREVLEIVHYSCGFPQSQQPNPT